MLFNPSLNSINILKQLLSLDLEINTSRKHIGKRGFIDFLGGLIFCPLLAHVVFDNDYVFDRLVELFLHGGEEFFPVSDLLFLVGVEFELCVELVEKSGELGLSNGSLVSDGASSLPLLENVSGGVLLDVIVGNSFEEIFRAFPKTGGLFGISIINDPIVVNMGNGNGLGFARSTFILALLCPCWT